MILSHMLKFNEKSKFLPYAWFITRIFEDFDVNFEGYESYSMDSASNKITIKNVDVGMGLIYNPETKTIVHIGEDVVGNEGNDQDVEGDEDGPPQQDPNAR